ncbi:MAG: hypothetical protein Ct9H300mP16_08280 [Pseudomonadota bacterium]|nr:MAG: hypothetical protein Ct9H300mP16_08280 [Pseudomonadota bacterium]
MIGAPSGMALAGGMEVLLHCDALQAHAETYMGLVEVGVGLVPAWGGCKEMLARWHRIPALRRVQCLRSPKCSDRRYGSVARSAEEARDMLYLRQHDGITMNRDRLLAEAKPEHFRWHRIMHLPNPHYRLPGPTQKQHCPWSSMTIIGQAKQRITTWSSASLWAPGPLRGQYRHHGTADRGSYSGSGTTNHS